MSTSTSSHDFPLITVIVLTYNSAAYVLSTLESIRQQDYQGELELIVGDDCSSDDTVATCRSWLENNSGRFTRAEILKPEGNLGLVRNLNACIKAARGEWIKSIAGDDIMAPYALRLFYETAAAAPGERLFLYSALKIFQHEEDLQEPNRLTLLPGGPGDQDIDLSYIYRKPNFWTNAPSFFFAKALIEQIGYVPRLFRNVEDRPLYTKVLASGFRIYHISKPTVYYRVHDASLTATMAGVRYAECNWKTYCEILRPCFSGIPRLDMDLRMLPQWYLMKQGGKNRKTRTFKLSCKIIWALYRAFTFPFSHTAGNTIQKATLESRHTPSIPYAPEH